MARASSAARPTSDAAVAISAVQQSTHLMDRLLAGLPGAAARQAAQVTRETAVLSAQALMLRTAVAQRASRDRALRKARTAQTRASRKFRMATPVFGSISASFGRRGLWSTRHTGLDIAARYGTPVRAVVAGTVIRSAFDRAYGRIVVIRGRGVDIWYAHLSAEYVKVGQRIAAGKRLGSVGCSGQCTGAHLHLEVRKHDLPTNPATFLWGSHRGKPGTTPVWARTSVATLDSL